MKRATRVLLSQPSLMLPSDLLPRNTSIVPHLQKAKVAQVTTLSNGFRVATKDMGGETATVGVWIDAGSRFESWETNGVAHFLEHMTFKGTHTRSRMDIERFFETSGGHLNAYTTREQTVYFVQVFKKDITPAFDRLTDILRCPRLLTQDLESERGTILKEKEDVETNIDEVMMDHVHLTCFPDDGLGMTILGLEKNISENINVEMIQEYIRTHYTAKRMVMVGCGGVNHDELVGMAEKMWGDLPSYPEKPKLQATFKPGHKVVEYNLASPNLSICWGVAPQSDYELLIAQILQFHFGTWDRHAQDHKTDNAIGGIYEDIGTSEGQLESIQAFTTPYSDVSLFGFYLVSSPVTTPEAFQKFQITIIRRLLMAMETLTEKELDRAKEALKVTALLLVDGTSVVADTLGGHMLGLNRDVSLCEMHGRIDAITLQEVRDAISKYITQKPFVFTGVGPAEFFPQEQYIQDQVWNRDASYQKAAFSASA